ncbi:MAG TPA: amidohydrolase [Fimbriimonadales bacterium]|nr:amidohydrolase [Fimbriimonadales bacterium]
MRILFKNGRWGFDGSSLSFLVENGHVVYRGDGIPITEREADKCIDLEGGFVLPGFVDCHCHILAAGLDLSRLNLSGTTKKEEVFEKLLEWSKKIRDDEWILAVHYDANRFEDGKDITAEELEKVLPGRAIVLRHSSGHACVVSKKALALAGIKDVTENPPGGTIVRNEKGEATGLLLENAMGLVYGVVPKPSVAEMKNAIRKAVTSMLSYGITCASDMTTGSVNISDELLAYQNVLEELPARARLYLDWDVIFDDFQREFFNQDQLRINDKLRINGVKLFADGAIGARTAAMSEPYTNGETGYLIYEQEELNEKVRRADEDGLQIAIHAIGDSAVDAVLNAYEKTKNPSTHRIEHAMVLSQKQIEKIKKMRTKLAMQPEFLLRFRNTYFKALGEERASKIKPIRSLLESGISVGFSSDRPIVSGDPWSGIEAATSRDGFAPEEKISLETALRAYTSGGAEVNGEMEYGGLEPGQYADFQVYERSPLEQPGQPKSVYISGERIYER